MSNNPTSINQTVVGPPIYKMPLLGERAAPFKAESTKGPINFPFDYTGKWVVFFSHPHDFEPICTTEFMLFQEMQEEFKLINTELLGLSVDSIPSHLEWIDSIYNIRWNDLKNVSINFPIVSDTSMEIAKKYGMLHRGDTETGTVRALFVIDPNSKIRNILYYDYKTGRNLEEVKRIVLALQESDKQGVGTPANWLPSEDVIIPMPTTTSEVIERYETNKDNKDIYCVSWYLCFKRKTPPSVITNYKNKPSKPSLKNLQTQFTNNSSFPPKI